MVVMMAGDHFEVTAVLVADPQQLGGDPVELGRGYVSAVDGGAAATDAYEAACWSSRGILRRVSFASPRRPCNVILPLSMLQAGGFGRGSW